MPLRDCSGVRVEQRRAAGVRATSFERRCKGDGDKKRCEQTIVCLAIVFERRVSIHASDRDAATGVRSASSSMRTPLDLEQLQRAPTSVVSRLRWPGIFGSSGRVDDELRHRCDARRVRPTIATAVSFAFDAAPFDKTAESARRDAARVRAPVIKRPRRVTSARSTSKRASECPARPGGTAKGGRRAQEACRHAAASRWQVAQKTAPTAGAKFAQLAATTRVETRASQRARQLCAVWRRSRGYANSDGSRLLRARPRPLPDGSSPSSRRRRRAGAPIDTPIAHEQIFCVPPRSVARAPLTASRKQNARSGRRASVDCCAHPAIVARAR